MRYADTLAMLAAIPADKRVAVLRHFDIDSIEHVAAALARLGVDMAAFKQCGSKFARAKFVVAKFDTLQGKGK